MNDNVIHLEKKEPMIWVCDCGCSTFYLPEASPPRCANCDSSAESGQGSGWIDCLPQREANKTADQLFSGVGALRHDTNFPRRRILRRLAEETSALVVVGFESGEVSLWSSAETEQQAEWAKSRLALAISMIDATVYDEKDH